MKFTDNKVKIENNLSKLFFKDVYDLDIVERVVVTDGIDEKVTMENTKIDLVSLEKFLYN